jgi:hypothetical protein
MDITWSTFALNGDRLSLNSNWAKSFGLGIEVELLSVSFSSGVDDQVWTFNWNDSSHWQQWGDEEWSVYKETECFVKTLRLIWDSSVDVKDLPFLGLWVVLFPGLDWLSFNISSHVNIKDVVVLDVDEVLVLVLEYLPPSWLNLFEAEDVSSGSLVSWSSNCEECMLWLISSNRLGPVVEVPFLWIETVCCLDDWLALNNIEISAGLKSRDNEE